MPAKFDDTELDGIRSTIGFINIKNMPPEEFAYLIIKKLGAEPNIPLPEKEEPKGNVYLGAYLQIDEIYGLTGINIGVTVTNTINGHRYFNGPYFTISKPIVGNADTFQMVSPMQAISFPKRMEYGEQYQVMYNLKQVFLDQLREHLKQNVFITAHVTTTVGEKFKSNDLKIDDIFKFHQ